MPGTTPELNLATALDSDDNADYLTISLANSLRTVDGLFNNVTGHSHGGAHQGGPITSVPAGAIADGSITSAKIADGTITAGDLAPGTTLVKLAELSGVSSGYDFQNIPQTYRHLWLVVYGRSDTTGPTTSLRLRLQNIATASYYDQAISASGSAVVAASEVIAGLSARAGFISAAGAPASLMGFTTILFPHYTQANKEKPYISQTTAFGGQTTGTIQIGQFGGLLDSTSPISRILAFPAAGSFVADSIATLYGLPL